MLEKYSIFTLGPFQPLKKTQTIDSVFLRTLQEDSDPSEVSPYLDPLPCILDL